MKRLDSGKKKKKKKKGIEKLNSVGKKKKIGQTNLTPLLLEPREKK